MDFLDYLRVVSKVLFVATTVLPGVFTHKTGNEIVEITHEPPCLKGKKCTLTCNVHIEVKYREWRKDGEKVCVYDKKRWVKQEGQYNCSINDNESIYNLTIQSVSGSDIGKEFTCIVAAGTDCRVIDTGDIEENENGTLTATTACYFRDKRVSIRWTKIDTATGKEEKFNPENVKKYNKSCSDEKCADDKTQRQVQIFPLVPSGNGTKYQLKMTVDYENGKIESIITKGTYKMEEQAEDSRGKGNPNQIIGGITVLVLFVIAIVATIWRNGWRIWFVIKNFGSAKSHKKGNEKEEKPFLDTAHDERESKEPKSTNKTYASNGQVSYVYEKKDHVVRLGKTGNRKASPSDYNQTACNSTGLSSDSVISIVTRNDEVSDNGGTYSDAVPDQLKERFKLPEPAI